MVEYAYVRKCFYIHIICYSKFFLECKKCLGRVLLHLKKVNFFSHGVFIFVFVFFYLKTISLIKIAVWRLLIEVMLAYCEHFGSRLTHYFYCHPCPLNSSAS